ncbi:MAG: ABC transporter ATP-binding protein [Alphaproteobacteria bacterium]
MKTSKFIIYAMRPYKYYLIGPILISIFFSFDASIRPYIIKLLVNAASETPIEAATQKIIAIIPWYIVLHFIAPFIWRIYDWCTLKYEPALKNHIAQILSKQIFSHSYNFFQNNFTGSIAAKINDVASYVLLIIFNIFFSFLQNGLGILTAFYALTTIHIWFSLSFLIWACAFVVFSYYSAKKSTELSRYSAEASSKVMGQIVDFLGNITSVRLFKSKKYELRKLGDVQENYLIASQQRRWYMLRFYFYQGIAFAIYQTFSILLLIKLYSKGQVTAGDFAMIISINIWIIDSLWDLSNEMRTFTENWGIVGQALNTIYQPIEIVDSKDAIDFKIKLGEINFDKVTFKYKKDNPLFNDLSVKINSGEKVGLVGYSGSGKTSFVNLILRLFDVTSGSILIDGMDIRNIKQDSLRASIATIPQDPSLFNRSIMENIRYGKLDASDEEVIQAAKLAHVDDFVQNFPEKYDMEVGERGAKLSGGQRQRIAIARAILKNAPILILDEATSQLDTLTEQMIQSSLSRLMQNRTSIVIAHRLSTLLNMDRIIVFDKGKIIQDGTHIELRNKEGLYKTLWDAQIEGFLPDKNNN